MKKALVLGVLAIFAISIANVNAQDRTNVQAKPKKTYSQEPTAKKNMDTKAINQQGKEQDPTAKNVTIKEGGKTAVQGTKGGNKVGKPAGIKDEPKKGAIQNAISTDPEKKAAKASETVEKYEKPSTVKTDDGKDDVKKVTTSKASTGKEIKSVPPTKKEKKAESGKVATDK